VESREIREKFLKFFQAKGHQVLKSSSLIPEDPTLLFTSAGMVQFKPYFLGKAKAPYSRITTCQKCVRTTDIDRVGETIRHLTFFEMLGNFSFGDYFKEEAIEWAWELVTEVFGIKTENLWVTVFQDDDEAAFVWQEKIGLPPERIVRLGEEDNFWAAGPTGPCGPCSEIIYDRGEKYGCGRPDCAVGCDCDRYFELWNLVFMALERDESGRCVPLPKKNIDTGMGLERAALLLQEKESVFETDLFEPVMKAVESLTSQTSSLTEKSQRIIADHARALTFLLSEGVLPSNEGRGYVVRRLLRRAVRHSYLIGAQIPALSLVAEATVENLGSVYPEIRQEKDFIRSVLEAEEKRFYETMERGVEILEETLASLSGKSLLPGEVVFRLYDTYGFPVELTREIAAEKGFQIDEEGFRQFMEKQKEKSRAFWSARGFYFDKETYQRIKESIQETEFLGYKDFSAESTVVALVKKGERVSELKEGEEGEVILERTPFYPEKGGQVGDRGLIFFEGGSFEVYDTQEVLEKIIVHRGKVKAGTLISGVKVEAKIDRERRLSTARHHTSTHLLHWALRRVLGEEVRQAGSYVGPEGLRFDFTYFQPLKPEEKEKIEFLVNKKILENHPVKPYLTTLEHAREIGAIALFGEKYGEFVRVLEIGNFSKELCGGTHVFRTGEIGLFQIRQETSIGANLRRIEAAAGFLSYEDFKKKRRLISRLTLLLQTEESHLEESILELIEKNKRLVKEIDKQRKISLLELSQELLNKADKIGHHKLVVAKVKVEKIEDLRELADLLRKEALIVLLGMENRGRALLLAASRPEGVELGFDSSELVKRLSFELKGKGGGRKDLAQGGGSGVENLERVLAQGKELIRSFLISSGR